MKTQQINPFTISVVCPVFNEGENLHELYRRITESISTNYSFEIIFVDDGSTDSSNKILREISLKDKRVCMISFTRNYGHQIALSAGYDYANGKCVISLDSDLQHPPEIITDMINKWEEGYPVVLTKRANNNLKFFKRNSSKLFYIFFSKLSKLEIVNDSPDFRLLDSKVVKSMQMYKESSRFIRGIIADMGYKYTIIDYDEESRSYGKTKYNLLKMLRFGLKGLLSFTNTPLRFSIYLGLLISLFCLLYTGWLIYYKFAYGNVAWMASVLVGIFFLGGIQLISLGILGEYIGNIFTEVKKRPLYCIDKVIRDGNESFSDWN
tara:strand:+ start:1257 stop:2222 length:966 start_codon:yes stop_codon:yes gene_type:complete